MEKEFIDRIRKEALSDSEITAHLKKVEKERGVKGIEDLRFTLFADAVAPADIVFGDETMTTIVYARQRSSIAEEESIRRIEHVLDLIDEYLGVADVRGESLKKFFSKEISENIFTKVIVPLRSLERNKPKAIDYARVANMMYQSIYFSTKLKREKYKTFQSFYKAFCEIMGCEYKQSFKPNKLNPTPRIKNLFDALR